jgi:hypothetical protein
VNRIKKRDGSQRERDKRGAEIDREIERTI